MVYQVASAVKIPIIGVGGISCADDVIEFMSAGASAVQVGAPPVKAGFETIGTQELEHRKFDVIASNIPFGNFRVFDADLWKKGGIYEPAKKTIHN